MRDAKHTILIAPFHGTMVPVMVQELTQAQTLACGNFSLIETFQDRIAIKRMTSGGGDLLKIIEYVQLQHELVRRSLVKPTYDEIIVMVSNASVDDAKRSVLELKEKLKSTPRGVERDALNLELDKLLVWTDYILPSDFLGVITAYALGVDKSDIKEVSRSMLLEAALLARRGNDNPADHIRGAFTDFMRDDINRRAWIIYEEEKKKKAK